MGGEVATKMDLENFNTDVTRKAWKSDNGSIMIAVTGLLQPGEYIISKNIDDNGNITLECKPKD